MPCAHPLLPPPAVLYQVVRGCPGPCSCPLTPPSCLVGVSLVLDVCGCCKVCAQQFNQDCGPDKPCDHIKGLRCHLGAGGDPQRGLCRGEKTQHTDMFPTILFPISYIQSHASPLVVIIFFRHQYTFPNHSSLSEKEVPQEFFRYLGIPLFLNVLLRTTSHSGLLRVPPEEQTEERLMVLNNIGPFVLLARTSQVPLGADVKQGRSVRSSKTKGFHLAS